MAGGRASVVAIAPTSALPDVDESFTSGYHFRFNASVTGSKSISVGMLGALLGVGAPNGAAKTVALLFSAVRVKRVRVTDVSGAPIHLTWLASTFGKDRKHTAEGNAGFPSIIDSKPPVESASSFWYSLNTGGNLFSLSYAANTTVVDVWLSATMSLASMGGSVTMTNAVLVGSVVTLPLDGVSAAPDLPSSFDSAAN